MSNLKAITPKSNQRMIAVGKTGTGKTTLVVALLPAYQHVLAIDPLHVLKDKLPSDYMVCHTPEQLEERIGSASRLLYQPSPEHMIHESYNLVYRIVFESGSRMVYTDEGLRVMRPNGQAPPYMEACYTAGRQRGVGMITATQRPSKVDLRVMSEAEHYVTFKLKLRQDRERMGELMGEEVVDHPAKGHSFWYSNDTTHETPIYLVLEED